ATGEGKTLTAVLHAYLGGLTGRGVHVLTFNDYLAHRDSHWMGPIYRFLGLSVGWVGQGMSVAERQAAYGCDITYVTAKEAGFDLLRSHLASEPGQIVHRPFHRAIVDEADSILIDEARVPLVIAGVLGSPEETPYGLADLVNRLDPDEHFETDEYSRNIELTALGIDRVEGLLDCGNLLAAENVALLTGINCALHAKVLLRRDVEYIVRDGRIQLVDELTGRVVEDRHWPDGLQAALEAKEGLKLRPEGRVLSSITLQHFVRLYPNLAGMTATASPAAEELTRTYGMDVVVIPQNRPSIRIDHSDVVFTHREAKHRALVEEIGRVHATGRPILVGTASVMESEELAALLRPSGIEPQILNARNDEMEAAIIAEAGALGAVTISTNMAGRGTDIRLGGADEGNRPDVVALGGLYVIGTNRHESLRIDQQLRGRAGRQGDPGSSRFFISLEDDLIARYGVRNLIPPKLLLERQDQPLDNPVIRREIARAQRIVEGQNVETRKTLYGYSSVLDEQRKIVQQRREDLLLGRAQSHFAELSPGRFQELSTTVDQAVLAEAERQIVL
ncbi:MAG: accessory Sec system translocase SecA2, partial [Thermoanaerobaculia bacterium]